MEGVGETETAIQYIFTRKSHFDAIFWLSADDKTFASIARHLGIEDESLSAVKGSRLGYPTP